MNAALAKHDQTAGLSHYNLSTYEAARNARHVQQDQTAFIDHYKLNTHDENLSTWCAAPACAKILAV